MNWYNGTIADAIRTSKEQQAIFVVYIEGSDDNSHLMTEVLNSGDICDGLSSNKIVAIKLSSNDVGYRQFVDIYKLVPIPSLFFIGNSGAPIDIVAADASRVNLETKIKEALVKCNVKLPGVSQSNTTIPPPETMKDSEPSTSQAAVTTDQADIPEKDTTLQSEGVDKPTLEARVEKAKKLIEIKKQEKEVKDMEEEKEKEFERRRVGQEMQKAKKNNQDRELKEMIEEREREKRESVAAKQRILEQIAQDRAERAEREQRMKTGNVNTPQVTPTVTVNTQSHPINVNVTRIQFKLPTGEAKTHSFPPDTTLLQVREFINNNIELSFREYRLATSFPRREFSRDDDGSTLTSLNLIPTGVILILPISGSVVQPYSRDWRKIITDIFWDMVSPVFTLGNYIQQYFTSRPSNRRDSEPSTSSAQQPSQAPRSFVRRAGNIHSLRDMRDGNDENNTWNGNSTQQM